ncbi:MAG: hypothetical protein KDB19_14360 [Microthrixaceae bacterium]|nr:hypothetical protein [Microthrixaceae bacterium]MCO5306281.1 hypothetical protein [Microthrixaceae bacterium]
MSKSSRLRLLGAPLLVLGAIGLLASCAPEPPPYRGIIFNAPSFSYIGRTFTPTATDTSGMPVTITLDASSTGCTFVGGVVSFNSLGTCVLNADQPGDATHDPSPRVQRSIAIIPCPPMRPGIWTGPMNLSADVSVSGSLFYGTIDLTSLGYGVQGFSGTVSCEVVNMTFNNVPLQGYLSPDGKTLSSNYQGIDILLNAPADAG